MKIRMLGAAAVLFAASSAVNAGLVINVHDANNFATSAGKVNLYNAQGAYSDPGNNVWNTFADTGSDGFTRNLLDSAGNPTGVDVYSDGFASNSGLLFTTAFGYKQADGSNLATGKPAFLLGEWEQRGGSAPITVTLSHVPAGTYSFYGYDASVDYDRGGQFALANGAGATGIAHNGINYTQNDKSKLSKPATQGGLLDLVGFTEGENYARIDNVVVNADGLLTIVVTPHLNALNGNNGETNFNGFQLVAVPEPTTLTAGLAAIGLLGRKRRVAR